MRMCVLMMVTASWLAAVACGHGGSSAPSAPSPAAPPSGATASVTIPLGASLLGDRAFSPGQVTVDAGGAVAWVNTDTVAHTSTANGNAWNSGTLAPGQQFSRTFATPGTFAYRCAIHPDMVGTVIVK